MNTFDHTQESWKPWKTKLAMDAVYFHAARQALSRLLDSASLLDEAVNAWHALVDEENRVLEKSNGDPYAAMDELEPIAIQMEDAHYQVGHAYAPTLKEAAIIHMLCCSALEAHINAIAREELTTKEYNIFEHSSLEAKWLFLPRRLGLEGFDVARQPYQDFSQLVRFRNALLHYKHKEERWEYGKVPKFVDDLGLTSAHAQRSINAADLMIEQLATQRGQEPHYWLRDDLDSMSYFDIKLC